MVESANQHGRAGHGVLRLARIGVPSWLAGTAMHYRLDYRKTRQLRAYAWSDWAAPPAALLEPIIQHTLAATGDWQAVVGPDNPGAATVILHLRIDDFGQRFTQPERSVAVVAVAATLLDARDNRVIAQRPFRITVPAASADAAGGAQALGEASRALTARLHDWLRALAPEQ